MSPQEAVNSIYEGHLVDCTYEEWPAVRSALQEAAGKWTDASQHLRASIALAEVRRLDAHFKLQENT